MIQLVFDGRRQSLVEWAAEAELEEGTLRQRLNSGWSVRRALTSPSHLSLRGGLPAYRRSGGVDVSRYAKDKSG